MCKYSMLKKILLLILCLPTLAFANAYAVLNYTTGQFDHEYNSQQVYSIASITKLFTVYTVIKSGVDLNEKIKVQGVTGGRFVKNSMVSRMDLIKSSLIASDNLASESLARAHPGGIEQFFIDVDEHVKRLGLTDTRITDSTGLMYTNVSTIKDLSTFLFHIKDIELIKDISKEKEDKIKYTRGNKTVTVSLRNTNSALWSYDNILISKTGFTNAAGRCVAMLVQKNKELFAVIVLGQSSPSKRTLVVNNLFKLIE